MNTFEFENRFGTRYTVSFEKKTYIYRGTAIEVWCKEPGSCYWEPYAMLTKNLGDLPPTNLAYLDGNNVPDLVEFVLGNGWCKKVGECSSGYCVYPLVEFTEEFLNEICISEEE